MLPGPKLQLLVEIQKKIKLLHFARVTLDQVIC